MFWSESHLFSQVLFSLYGPNDLAVVWERVDLNGEINDGSVIDTTSNDNDIILQRLWRIHYLERLLVTVMVENVVFIQLQTLTHQECLRV